jgi:chromosome segregation ATPase
MAKYAFYNIGQANAEITRLNAKIESLEKGGDASALADALASNEQISAQLTQANADLATANQNASTLTTNLEKAQGEVNSIGAAIKSACDEMKLEVKAGATSLEMIAAMKGGVSSTLAKLNVPVAAIPAAAPLNAGGEQPKTELKGRAKMIAAMKIEGITPKN